MSSPVRGIYTGDQNDYNTTSAEFITIASKGNCKRFWRVSRFIFKWWICIKWSKGNLLLVDITVDLE